MQARGRDRVFLVGCSTLLALGAALLPFDQDLQGLALGRQAAAQESGDASEKSGPKRHFKVDRPAELSDAAAATVYLRILDEMVSGYRMSHLDAAADYRTWRRYNKTPYRSATHGERFVNNYGNSAAKAYGEYEKAGELPLGALLAKDSFAVTSRGDVFLGPLFLMEKMAPGFNPGSSDWRYSMVMPDGSLFGMTRGEGSERVEFCITCHEAEGNDVDPLFFVPTDYRIKIFSVQPDE